MHEVTHRLYDNLTAQSVQFVVDERARIHISGEITANFNRIHIAVSKMLLFPQANPVSECKGNAETLILTKIVAF